MIPLHFPLPTPPPQALLPRVNMNTHFITNQGQNAHLDHVKEAELNKAPDERVEYAHDIKVILFIYCIVL